MYHSIKGTVRNYLGVSQGTESICELVPIKLRIQFISVSYQEFVHGRFINQGTALY